MIGRIFSSNKGSTKSTKHLLENFRSKEIILDVKVDLHMRVRYTGSWINKCVVA